MSSEEFRYWERNSWRNYLVNYVIPLYVSSSLLGKAWSKVSELANGKYLSEVIKIKPSIEKVFVGGTSPPDRYEERSLALLYRNIFGTSVSLREYYFLKAHGKEPKTKCSVKLTYTLVYINCIADLLRQVINHSSALGIVSEDEVSVAESRAEAGANELLNKPEELPERVVEFLNKALSVTVAYNKYTRFIWYLRKIPRKYISKYYPKLLKPENLRFIKELLGLREYIIPQVEDQEIKEMYTIYSFDHEVSATFFKYSAEIDGVGIRSLSRYLLGEIGDKCRIYETVGGCICRVNELVWGMTRWLKDVLELATGSGIPDPLKDWMKMVNVEAKLHVLNYPKSYEDLSYLDEVLPAVFVGRAELIKDKYRDELHVVLRW